MTDQELDQRFDHHPPGNQMIADAHGVSRQLLKEAAADLNGIVPEGREKSLMFTHLEEAMFWANVGIARQQKAGVVVE